ncbi:MAG: trigger factor, partial [Oscillospiraceae bacterium]|nr:trigger factor [Oscillospiraceae bacterium]
MSSVLDKREKNIVTLTITVSPEDFEKAVDRAYRKNRKRYQVAGFRKGKAPRRMIERMYGEGVFFDDAINEAFPAEYEAAIEEFDLKPVAMPSMTKLDKIGYEEGLVFTIEVEVEPEFELPEYKGIEITPIEYEVKEEDIDREIERVREQNARLLSVEDTEAKSGDTVIIDFDGYVDGEQFEGGQSENYSLELGSNSFIPGFEDQLIGKKAGEDVDVNVTFPEDYHAAELAGKDSVFKVKIHEVKVKELPEVDDDFAADVSEFDTVEEYRESLSKKIKEERENALKG